MNKAYLAALLTLSISSTHGATLVYRTAILANSPVAYYEFDETTGTTAADTITTLDGTYTGSLGLNATSFSDNLGAAVDFTGGHVAIPNLGTYAQSTIEMWVQFDTVPGACCGALLTANGWALGKVHLNGNANQLEYAVNGEAFVTTTVGIAASQWYHLVVTNDVGAAETNFYLNGALVADTGDNSLQNVVFGTTGMQIGDWDGQARTFDGRIDEVAVYDSVLSSTDVTNHFNAATIPEPAGVALLLFGGAFVSLRRRR